MSRNDREKAWAQEQLQTAGASLEESAAVIRLLEVWWPERHTQATARRILEMFTCLSNDESLQPPVPEVWEQVRLGAVFMRDLVRVAADAYKGDAGRAHNGRRGVVQSVRSGDIIVRYTDGRQPDGQSVHHPPNYLEKRIA